MKKNIYINTFIVFISLLAFATATFGQDGATPETQPATVKQPQDQRINFLRQLGLSREQIQQIRRFNAERKPLMDEAQKRSRDANRLLDEAIYANQVNESEVQARLKEVQLAQAEIARLRFMNELSVRRILTPEQLVRFRELRQKFEQARENIENRRPLNSDRPINDRNPAYVRPLRDNKQQIRPIARPIQQRPQF